MAQRGTVGELLIDDILPAPMQGRRPILDKRGVALLLSEVAKEHPESYSETVQKLSQLGRLAAFTTGGNSFGPESLTQALSAKKRRLDLNKKINVLLDDDQIDDEQRNQQLIKLTSEMMDKQQDEIFQESLAEQNPLAIQLIGAGRGNKMNLAGLRGSDGLYQDHHGKVIPVPVLRSYSQGLSPMEFWAGTYGARAGLHSTKFSVAESGYLSKVMNQIAHRSLVTADDDDREPDTVRGLPVDINDDDSEGSLLAAAVGGYKRNTVLTPKILRELRKQGVGRLLVRSPAVTGPPDGGVYARDAGVREYGRLPTRGEQVGLTAVQAMGEPLSQGLLSAKHTSGVAGATKQVSGFDYIESLISVPKTMKGGAAHATLDGMVNSIEKAPAGGHFITVNGEQHYVGAGYAPQVKVGDRVEAGDVLSEGIPNPSIITQYKGIGEGRRYFIDAFREAFRSAGLNAHRRNIELLSRGLINHVRLTQEVGEHVPDDVVPYSAIEHSYEPREGFRSLHPKAAVGKHLERPYLHHTIGTRLRPSMLKDFEDFGIKSVDVHDDPPPFEPEMLRGMANLQHDPDWMVRMFGSGLKGSLLKGVHRGATSDEAGTSFVPARARAVDFGRIGPVHTPDKHKLIKGLTP